MEFVGMILRIEVDSIPATGWVSCIVQQSAEGAPDWEELVEAKEDNPEWWDNVQAFETIIIII